MKFVSLLALLFCVQASAEVSLSNKQSASFSREALDAFSFRDEDSKDVKLSSYFLTGKPTLLAFVYFDCPGTCTLLLNGMIKAMSPHIYIPGRDFELVVVSIDPKDSPTLASEKKKSYLEMYGRPDTATGWHFLTGQEPSIKALTDAVGFHYEYDAKSGQFNHPSALFFFTGKATLSSVQTGLRFPPAEFRGAITDAASGRLGTFTERVNALCITYLPHVGWLDRPARWGIAFLAFLVLACSAIFALLHTRNRFAR